MSQMFDYEACRKAARAISLWEKIQLVFCKPQKSVDIQGNKRYTVWYKVLRGKVYYINDWYEVFPTEMKP